jgi:hypothetical protein
MVFSWLIELRETRFEAMCQVGRNARFELPLAREVRCGATLFDVSNPNETT